MPTDKRRRFLKLLHAGEWSRWSDREIARRSSSSHTTQKTIIARSGDAGAEGSPQEGASCGLGTAPTVSRRRLSGFRSLR